MDPRTGLEKNSVLDVTNREGGQVRYTVEYEIGRGASGIVYDGFYLTNAGSSHRVRIKECWPFKLSIGRDASGCLIADPSCADAFLCEKERFRSAFEKESLFFASPDLTNASADALDIYEANNTLYIVTAYVEGSVLSYDPDRSMREILSILRSTARVISRIHQQGYLYPDLKPDNIFLFRETEDMIRLFDFDSLLPYEEGCPLSLKDIGRPAFTKGFSPMEMQVRDRAAIGPWSDVYSVGALAFYLIFGRCPTAFDSDEEACFDYSESLFRPSDYRDKLKYRLTDFLHGSLAGYYKDRYQTMEQALEILDELYSLSDLSKPFIRSGAALLQTSFVTGRDQELSELIRWWSDTSSQTLLVTGIGGIGKSTLVRQFITEQRSTMDSVLYLNYDRRINSILADDLLVLVNTLERQPGEPEQDYVKRKLRTLKTMGLTDRNLLVIDNFEGQLTSEMSELLSLNWKVILISRESRYQDDLRTMTIGPIGSFDSLKTFFEKNLRREIKPEESEHFTGLVRHLQGHTLGLELLARQIACSHITLEEAEQLAGRMGISGVGREKIDLIKDQSIFYETVGHIISRLFQSDDLSPDQKHVLKMLTLLKSSGISIGEMQAFLRLNTKDEINGVRDEGWLEIREKNLSLHPIIYEAVDAWEWDQDQVRAALSLMTELMGHFSSGAKDDIPAAASPSVTRRYLQLSEQVLDKAGSLPELRKTEAYKELLFRTVMTMPYDREAYILDRGRSLTGEDLPRRKLMKLRRKVAEVLMDQGAYPEAERELALMKEKAGRDHYCLGLYYDMLSDYGDHVLDGEYGKVDDPIYLNMAHAAENAISHMKKAKGEETGDRESYVSCWMGSRVIMLIRSFPEKKAEIKRELTKLREQVEKHAAPVSEERYILGMCLAWYYTYVVTNAEKVRKWVGRANVTAEKLYTCPLDYIDNIHIPYANMMLECAWQEDHWDRKLMDEASAILRSGLAVCRKHREATVYQRKELQLLSFLIDVEIRKGDMEKCRSILAQIDELHARNKDLRDADYVSEEMRAAVRAGR